MAEGMAQAKINNALDTEITGTVWVQLHTGDPGAAGTANVATNNTRASVTFAAASGGSKASNADVSWSSVPATETYSAFSLWTASSAGTFLYSGAITSGAVTSGALFKIASGQLVLTGTGAA